MADFEKDREFYEQTLSIARKNLNRSLDNLKKAQEAGSQDLIKKFQGYVDRWDGAIEATKEDMDNLGFTY